MTDNTSPAAAVEPVFADAEKRLKTVPLEWPFSVAGKTYDKVIIRRMNQGEVAAMIAKLTAQTSGAPEMGFPIFYDVDGNLLPDEVMAAMDADDASTLDEAARDFLPRRFRQLTD